MQQKKKTLVSSLEKIPYSHSVMGEILIIQSDSQTVNKLETHTFAKYSKALYKKRCGEEAFKTSNFAIANKQAETKMMSQVLKPGASSVQQGLVV